MKKKVIISTVVFLVFVMMQNVCAFQDDASLEDLIYMGVSVATKKVEKIEQAPAVVSLITAEEIANTAAENLYDIIEMIPGVTVTESFFGYTSLSFRGIKESHYNNRTLLLLNNIPIRDVIIGTHWLEAIPSNVIQKIEIIRGPGSVLYGTGAFAGVINIITKSKQDITEVEVGGGSKETIDAKLTYGMKQQSFDFLVGGSYHESNGYQVNAIDEAGELSQLGYYEKDQEAYENDFYNAFGSFSSHGFRIDAYHFHQEKDKFGLIPRHSMTGEAKISAMGSALFYEKTLGDLLLHADVHYGFSSYEGYLDSFAGTEIDMINSGIKYGAIVEGIYELMEAMYLNAGITYEKQEAEPYEWKDLQLDESHWGSTFLKKYETSDIAVYSQIELMVIEQLKFVGGVRYNNNSEYGGTTVPRVSMVYMATDKLSVKLLYGSAFRNPTFFEKYVNTRNVLYGNPELKPERIDTLEMSSDWSIAHQKVRLTLFGLQTDDMIGRTRTYQIGEIPLVTDLEDRGSDTTPTQATPGYDNAAGQRIYGLEFEVQGDVLNNNLLTYQMNCSYKEGKEKITWSPIQFLDQIVVNAALVNRIYGFTNKLSAHYIGVREGNISDSSTSPEFEPGQKITVPACVMLNWKTSYRIISGLEVSLVLKNILGQEVLYPEYVRRNIDVVPGDSGRNVLGQVKYRF